MISFRFLSSFQTMIANDSCLVSVCMLHRETKENYWNRRRYRVSRNLLFLFSFEKSRSNASSEEKDLRRRINRKARIHVYIYIECLLSVVQIEKQRKHEKHTEKEIGKYNKTKYLEKYSKIIR